MLRLMLLLTALILPVSASAVPATMEVLNGSDNGFKFSFIHDASDCEDGGFFMCGTKIGDPIEGILAADHNSDTGNGLVFSAITGSLVIGGLGTYDVSSPTGGLNFDTMEGDLIGALSFSPLDGGPALGTYLFFDLAIFPGAPNGYEGTNISLWGQNFGQGSACPGEFGFPDCGADGPFGIDIRFDVPRRDTPEPALFGLLAGAAGLLVMGRRRA